MLFHSTAFFIFIACFFLGFSLLRGHVRIVYTTVASYIFYGWWYPPYVFLLFGLSVYAYFFSFKKLSKAAFAWVVAAALMPLVVFKYTGFISENLFWLMGRQGGENLYWTLPLGISFITFTVISYLVDVRTGRAESEKSFWRFMLYLSYFPHLIAGPIMRARELLPQLKHLVFKPKLLKLGVLLFSVGMVKKVIVADQLAPWVEVFYGGTAQDLPHGILAFYAFPVQIYCDFSGYVDMALGIAFIMGIRLPLNFNAPYTSASVREFWRRWHITLSRWLRDYVYIPLGGSRHGAATTVMAMSATMILGGLWHGASWTFVIWGALHASWMILEHFFGVKADTQSKPHFLRTIGTFHLVALAWIFFRAGETSSLAGIFGGFFVPGDWAALMKEAVFPCCLILATLALHFRDKVSFMALMAKKIPAPYLYAISLVLILTCKIISVGNPGAFIYFDF